MIRLQVEWDAPGHAEITAISLGSGKRIARGYYRFGGVEAAPYD